MKKILLMMVAVLSLSMIFTSCNKDGKAPDSLAGTSWVCIQEGKVNEAQFRIEMKLTFEGNTFIMDMLVVDLKTNKTVDKSTQNGSYTYASPNVKLSMGKESTNGVVNAIRIVFNADDEEMIFTRD